MSADPRAALGAAQLALLAALVAQGPTPEGFDAERVALQARALVVKRARVAAAHHPWLADALGEGYLGAFTDFARSRPPAAGGGGHADAAGFEAYLRGRGELPRPPRATLRGRLRRRSAADTA